MPNYTTKRNRSGNWGNRTPTGGTGAFRATKTYSPAAFNNVNKNIQQWIGSFRNIKSQCTGAGKVCAFSPTGVNKWIKYVNDGNCVYKFSNADFNRYFGGCFKNTRTTPTPTTATRTLRKNFGAGIKDVTRGKGGCWLVAATPAVNKGPFRNYKW